MGDEVRHDGAATRTLKVLAAVMIVAAGLKIAAPLLLPIVVAGCLTLVALPAQQRLMGWGLPKGLAILLTVLGAVVALAAFTSLLTSSLSAFAEDVPTLRKEIDSLAGDLVARLQGLGWDSSAEALQGRFNPNLLRVSGLGASAAPRHRRRPIVRGEPIRAPCPRAQPARRWLRLSWAYSSSLYGLSLRRLRARQRASP